MEKNRPESSFPRICLCLYFLWPSKERFCVEFQMFFNFVVQGGYKPASLGQFILIMAALTIYQLFYVVFHIVLIKYLIRFIQSIDQF